MRGLVRIVGIVAALAGALAPVAAQEVDPEGVLNAAFVCTEGVFNSELLAPYDVLQHSVFRDSLNYILPFIVTEDGAPFTSFEGLTIAAHHSFESAPPIDILIIPSSENSMGADLENRRLMDWLRDKVAAARWVVTLCDGAFPLAATGALDGKVATTFPGDRERFAKMFPAVEVRYDVRFVVDGKYITSVGGAPSYEPAFYLVQYLYSAAHAARTSEGLVFGWDLDEVPHLIVEP